MRRTKLTFLAALPSIAVACWGGGGTVDIGGTPGSKLSDYAASWDGYAEAYAFDSTGSDRVRLTLDENGQGSIRFGDADLIAPPTDPNLGYPPGYDPAIVDFHPQSLTVGFAYPVASSSVEANRIRLAADTHELFRAWCAIQPPVANDLSSTGYGCVDNTGLAGNPSGSGCLQIAADGTESPIDCAKYALCMWPTGVCSCTATACSVVPPTQGYGIQLDGAIDMATTDLVGTLVLSTLSDGPRVTVRLHRN
jgi:hypothetical protein